MTLKGNCGTSLPGQGIKSSFFWGHQWKQCENRTNGSKVVAKISICHAVQWGRPFCSYYPECNIQMWFLFSFSKAFLWYFADFWMAVKQWLFFKMYWNPTQIRDTSWVTMSNSNLVWSFILRPLNYHSNLNLPSNHISSINDMPNLLKTFKLSFNRIIKYYVPIYMQYFQF